MRLQRSAPSELGIATVEGPGVHLAFNTTRAAWRLTAHGIELALGASTTGEVANDGPLSDESGPPHSGTSHLRIDLAERSISLSTCRFGVRPICFRLEGSAVVFSDRADAMPPDDTELDLQALYHYVYFHVIPAPRTIFAGVHRLDAAHRLLVGPEGTKVARTWSPTFETASRTSLAEQKSRFKDILARSVGNCADGGADGGAVGAFLSGGTDSSTVAGMLRQVTKQRPPTFSIGFEDESYDEIRYARIAARHFGTDHHEHYVTPDHLVEKIPLVAAYYDQPFGNSSALPAFCCAELARAHGVRKLLAGDGGSPRAPR